MLRPECNLNDRKLNLKAYLQKEAISQKQSHFHNDFDYVEEQFKNNCKCPRCLQKPRVPRLPVAILILQESNVERFSLLENFQ